jgi:hypothetical protein
MAERALSRPSLVEPFAVWALFLVVAAMIVVTYARLPAEELYNTDVEGLRGGLGRALVFLNYSTGLAVPALVAIVAARARSRAVSVLGLVAIGLMVTMGIPGVVDEHDLDAKAANAVPALGAALALGLTIWVAAREGVGPAPRRVPFDGVRIVLGALLALAAIPWIAAELGFYAGFGGLFMAGEVTPEPAHPDIRAVHLGHHHGLDGVLLALTALALTRELGRIAGRWLRMAATAYLSLLLVYGLANALEDFWLEQLYKRGTTSFKLPSMLRPGAEPEWLGMLLAAGAVYAVLARLLADDVRPALAEGRS